VTEYYICYMSLHTCRTRHSTAPSTTEDVQISSAAFCF